MLNDAERKLLALYRKAYEEGEVRVTFDTHKVATRMRFMMYRLAKTIRQADELEVGVGERLVVESVAISLDDNVMVCRNESMSAAFAAIDAIVGEVETIAKEDERLTAEAMERFGKMGLLGEGAAREFEYVAPPKPEVEPEPATEPRPVVADGAFKTLEEAEAYIAGVKEKAKRGELKLESPDDNAQA
jgi:hypothetical protein